jgi:SAM-dependent methyltransferase
MDSLPFFPSTFDLIWAEGSIFIIGIEKGIKSWKKILKAGGFLAFTGAVWFTGSPSEKARSFWKEHYPAMKTAEKIKDLANDSGYRCMADFPLTA